MPKKFNSSSIMEMLSNASPESLVRVIVRPAEQVSGEGERLEVDPKNFKTPFEYRSTLIANQKARFNPGKEAVVTKAQELGLKANAAESINAVLVEGHPHKVLDLLKEADIESATVEKPISFGSAINSKE